MNGQPFIVKFCAHSAIAKGQSASSLWELKEKLASIDIGCIYYHFWGIRMNPKFIHMQHHNDFAHWAFHRLHDHVLAEKLSVMDPKEFNSLEELRLELVETIETRLDDYEIIVSTRREDRFNFICSSLIAFESPYIINDPKDLASIVEKLPPNSIFYHFIDARTRTLEKIDDFSFWLKTFGDQYSELIQKIQLIDSYFLTLNEIKSELLKIIRDTYA